MPLSNILVALLISGAVAAAVRYLAKHRDVCGGCGGCGECDGCGVGCAGRKPPSHGGGRGGS